MASNISQIQKGASCEAEIENRKSIHVFTDMYDTPSNYILSTMNLV
jgi:hypothetical protein